MVALASVFTACSDAFDINQDGQRPNPEQLYVDATTLNRGVTGLYRSFPQESEIEFASIFTDEVAVGLANGNQGITDGGLSFFLLPGSADAQGIWNAYHSIVRDANEMLVIVDKLIAKTSAADEIASLKNMKAELLTIRAFSHLKLFSYFTPDYRNPSGLSVIKFDFVPSKDLKDLRPRSTVSEIKAFILKDLADADTFYTSSSDIDFRASKLMGQAIRVKLGTMTGDAALVQDNFTALSARKKMIDKDDYVHLFNENPKNSSFFSYTSEKSSAQASGTPRKSLDEMIFYIKKETTYADAVASAWYSVRVTATGSPFFEMGRSLFNDFVKLDATTKGTNDVRYGVNILPASKIAPNYESLSKNDYLTKDVLLIGKYKGRASKALQNNVPVLRYTDMLLSLAEIRAEQGALTASSTDPDDLKDNFTSVESILFNVRYYRAQNKSLVSIIPTATPEAAYKAILNERRVEFAFEGYRYLDMKRLGVKAKSAGFTRDPKDVELGGLANLPVNDFRMTFPIPNSEMRSNDLMVQNPGYSN